MAASPATSGASSVLRVPGGPYSSTPFGIRAPSAWNFFGFSRNSLISCSSSTASSTPATSRKLIFGESADSRLARDLPNDITFDPPPWRLFISRNHRPKKRRNGRRNSSSEDHVLEPCGTMLYGGWFGALASAAWTCENIALPGSYPTEYRVWSTSGTFIALLAGWAV